MLIKKESNIIQGYLEDASGFTQAKADKLVIPENEKEVIEYLKLAYQQKEKLTISGGRTGVTAGCLPKQGTIFSLERLNKLEEIKHNTITLQPGTHLATLNEVLNNNNFIYGPDPTETSATLGGNAATNASGARSFKYGATREHIIGLTLILSNGDKLEIKRGQYKAQSDIIELPLASGKKLVFERPKLPALKINKNSSGYFSKPNMDAIELLIGMEGTLGIITSLTLKLLPKPKNKLNLVIFFSELEKTLEVIKQIRALRNCANKDLPQLPCALEFMDDQALNLLRSDFTNIPKLAKAVLILEQEYFTEYDINSLTQWENFFKQNNISDNMVWLADDPKECQRIKDFRHALPEKINTIVRQRKFSKVGTDMAVPIPCFDKVFKFYQQVLTNSNLEYVIFGHIGDCHLHVNVLPKTESEYIMAKNLYLNLAQEVIKYGGTISAEHGIGKLKHDFLKLMVGENGIQEMIRIKNIFDPIRILNPDNIFPASWL